MESKHCDEYIDDKTQPLCLRRFLRYKRWSAIYQSRARGLGVKAPKLFATYKQPDGPGGRKGKTRRVRVVMASRFGDVGITRDLMAEHGYNDRVAVETLTDFSEKL